MAERCVSARPFPSKPRAWLFDLDGTLVDSEPAHWQSVLDVLAELGIERSRWPSTEPPGWTEEDLWSRVKPALGLREDLEQLAALRDRAFQRAVQERPVPIRPGARELLEALARDGVPRLVVSASPRRQIAALLSGAGLTPFLNDWVSTFEDVPRDKPFPDGYLEGARRLAQVPPQCVAVEDSPHGVEAAHLAGTFVVYVPSGGQRDDRAARERADLVLPSLTDLLDLITEAG